MYRRVLTLIPLLCVSAAITALVLINISGTTTNSIVDRFYFSELDGSYRWTMYGICQKIADGQYHCSNPAPAFPYSPAENLAFTNPPREFVVDRSTYYYLSRVAYGFFLLGLLFATLTLMSILLPGCCVGARSGSPASTVSFMAFFFAAIAATLDSVAHVKGVQVFHRAGFRAEVGRDMFVCMWVAVALTFVAFAGLALRDRMDQQRLVHPKMTHV